MANNKINLILQCPHCNDFVLIEELNCRIFRHAIIKSTNQQINPHATKSTCEHYISNKLIYGCGKPFIINIINNKYEIDICDYI